MATTPNWAAADIDMVKEACRHGEAQLDAQLQIAIAADQRASVMAGLYAAAATGTVALVAASATLSANPQVVCAAGAAAAAFLAAAMLCIKASLPVKFWTPGNRPSEWYDDIAGGKALKVAIGEQADHFDQHIASNNTILASNGRWFLSGALLGVFAPVLGLAAFAIARLAG